MAINSNSSKRELVDYLRDVHGVDHSALSRQELLDKASELDGVDYNAQLAPSGVKRNKEALEIAKQPKVKIRIASTESDKSDVFVGVNGVGFLIMRDVDVEVPEAVYEVLNNAKQMLYKSVNGELVAREVHSYPFSVVR